MENTNRTALAGVLVLAAMMLFGLIDNYMRLAAETGGLWQFHMLRSVVALAILVPLAWATGQSIRPQRPRYVLGRSLLNASSMVIYFGCLAYMPIAQAVAGLFTAPFFVVLYSVVFFGEKVGPRRIFAVLLGFAGIVLVLRPDQQGIGWINVLPVMSGSLYALGNMMTRRWCATEGTLTLLGAFFGCIFVFGTLGMAWLTMFPVVVPQGADGFVLRGWVWPGGTFGLIILVQGVGSLIGVGLSIKAYQLADATFVAVFENMLLVFATVWAVILWGQKPDAVGLVGLAMIVAAGVIIALRTEAPQPVRAPALTE